MCTPPIGPPVARGVVGALSAAVGVVLGDAGIVILALPDILREFNASVGGVAWVLIASGGQSSATATHSVATDPLRSRDDEFDFGERAGGAPGDLRVMSQI